MIDYQFGQAVLFLTQYKIPAGIPDLPFRYISGPEFIRMIQSETDIIFVRK
jgi:hypothetical protein